VERDIRYSFGDVLQDISCLFNTMKLQTSAATHRDDFRSPATRFEPHHRNLDYNNFTLVCR
jgi:hypothetical protein